ncbi:serine hydrolase domain-containing protein [Rhodalgimonas zhirmunskyi]|uniref:Beta-lactamase family protein n=1 Tax=Rhodalgimonas zhirmunskyi TaxID=2964767 RepID=A0AAJ1U3D1_9RHOB|nr:serine hydrolase domain-containing protein [Rhodoalgimonas zhirmunskyi]MDQ2092495.1 beta-lactamase family protein [Rhodoalgimonas zhirmunskyi]
MMIDRADIAPLLPNSLGEETPGYAFALMVADEAQIVCQGLASLGHNVEITSDTAFRIASVTKHFLALTAQMLHNKGVVDLDAPLGSHLEELTGVQAAVTMRQALNNSSGIRDHLELAMMAGGALDQPISRAQSYELICRQQATNFEAGSSYLYSNANFFLVTEAVERVTGRNLGDLLNENFFEPNEMTGTSYEPLHLSVISNMATGYVDRTDHFEKAPFLTELTGDGAMVSTLSDLVRWYRYLRADPDGLFAQISEITTFTNGETAHYGLGIFTRPFMGSPVRGHQGLWPGYRADLAMFDALDIGAICLTNVNTLDPTTLTRSVIGKQMVQSGSARLEQPKPDADALAAMVEADIFLNTDTLEHFKFSVDQNELIMEISGWTFRHPITGASEIVFKVPSDYLKLDWSEAAEGRVILTKINGDKVVLEKTTFVDQDEALKNFVGTYRCDELNSAMEIRNESGGMATLRSAFAHSGDWIVTPITDEIFTLAQNSGPWPRQVTGKLVEGGRSVMLSGPRVKNMKFMAEAS